MVKRNHYEPMVHFEDRKSQLKWGIVLAWFLNFGILAGVLEASILIAFLASDSTNEEILKLILITLPVSILISAIAVSIISANSHRLIPAVAGGSVRMEPGSPVYNVVEEMVVASGWPTNSIPDVYVAENVSTPNAYAISWRSGSSITFTRGLLDIVNREELQAVAAHEMAHITSGDSKAMTKLIAMSSLAGIITGVSTRMFYFGGGSSNRNRSSNNGGGGSNPVAIVILILSFVFLLVSPLLMALSQSFMSRKRESQADAFAVQFTRNPSALSSALQKIASTSGKPEDKESKKFNEATRQLAFWSGSKHFSTHTPLEERLDQLRRMGSTI